MPSSFLDSYRLIAARVDFDPDSTQYKGQVKRLYNAHMRHLCALRNWTFMRKVATVTLSADVTTGLVTLTNGSATVTGVGTSWTTAMEGRWINIGTASYNPSTWARIGRVASATSLRLESPWTPATSASTTYTIRQRYVQMPRDCLRYQTVWDEQNDRGMLRYVNPYEADKLYLDPDISGTPFWYTDAPTYHGPTPDRAPTAALVAGGTLSTSISYTYKYTWTIGGCETGSSADVTATPTAGNQTIRLTGLQEVSGTDGRYLNVYRSESDVGVFYKLGTYSNVTQIDDDGSVTPDRTTPYFDGNESVFVRVFPRNSNTTDVVASLRYQYVPREIQKDSDYPDIPNGDALDAIQCFTIADLIAKAGNDAIAETWRKQAQARIRELERVALDQEPQETVRRTWWGSRRGYRVYVPNPVIT